MDSSFRGDGDLQAPSRKIARIHLDTPCNSWTGAELPGRDGDEVKKNGTL